MPQLFDWLERCGLRFGRWLRQAPYLAQCGSLARTPHAARLAALPPMEQYAAVELWRGTMLRHSLIAYRADRPGDSHLPRFDGDDWLGYTPLRLPETISVRERLPAGAAAALINRSHSDPDLVLFVDAAELQMVEAIDGRRSIADIVQRLARPASPRRKLPSKLATCSSACGGTIRSCSTHRIRTTSPATSHEAKHRSCHEWSKNTE